jgi:hypothetical protein
MRCIKVVIYHIGGVQFSTGAQGQKNFAAFVKHMAKTDEQKDIETPEEWEEKVGFEFKITDENEGPPSEEAPATAGDTAPLDQEEFAEFVKKNAKTDEQRAIKTPEEWAEKVGFEGAHP